MVVESEELGLRYTIHGYHVYTKNIWTPELGEVLKTKGISMMDLHAAFT